MFDKYITNFMNAGAFALAAFFSQSAFSAVNYSGQTLDSNSIDFTSSEWDSTSFVQSNFMNSSAQSVKFSDAVSQRNFQYSFMVGGNFTDASFVSADLSGAMFLQATLTGAKFDNAIIENAQFLVSTGFTKEQFYSTASYKNSNVNGVKLNNLNLQGWEFGNLAMDNMDFSQANITGVNFAGSTVTGAIFIQSIGFTKEQLYSTKSYAIDKNLSGISLTYGQIENWSFKDINLSGAVLQRARLNGVDFTNADLRGANLGSVSGEYIVKNTIGTDGVVSNFSFNSASDKLTVNADQYASGKSLATTLHAGNVKSVGSIEIKSDATLNADGLNLEDTSTLNLETFSTLNFSGTNTLSAGTVVNSVEFPTISIESGTTTINADMKSFGGTLYVNGGTINFNNSLGASEISIAQGATLGVQINGDNMFFNAELTSDWFYNQGQIILTAKAGLAAKTYTVAASGLADFGQVVVYGGTLSGNEFTVSGAQTIAIDEKPQEAIVVTDNGRLVLNDNSGTDAKIEMAFNSNSATVNEVKTTTNDLVAVIGEDFNKVEAYSFDVNLSEGDSVTLSFYIGDSNFNTADFLIFHKQDGGEWETTSDISNLLYDGEYLSFVVSHFSEYGFAVVPEPSAYAAILGAFVLAFALRRRRR